MHGCSEHRCYYYSTLVSEQTNIQNTAWRKYYAKPKDRDGRRTTILTEYRQTGGDGDNIVGTRMVMVGMGT